MYNNSNYPKCVQVALEDERGPSIFFLFLLNLYNELKPHNNCLCVCINLENIFSPDYLFPIFLSLHRLLKMFAFYFFLIIFIKSLGRQKMLCIILET